MTLDEKIALLVDELEDIRCDNFDADTDEDKTLKEAIRAIKELEQEPCDDCVRRREVLDVLKDKWNMFSDANDAMQESIDTIEALKPVTPQPKMGHWIYDRTRDWDGECKYECSECGMGSDVDYAYCMRCGAKMESEDKE